MLQGEHSAILSTFIKLPVVIKIFVLSIFEWPFNTSFTVKEENFDLSIEMIFLTSHNLWISSLYFDT